MQRFSCSGTRSPLYPLLSIAALYDPAVAVHQETDLCKYLGITFANFARRTGHLKGVQELGRYEFNGEAINKWFSGSAEIDEEIRGRFGIDLEDMKAGKLEHWVHT